MTVDQERWAEALAIERRYGDAAQAHVMERVRTLAATGDAAGVQRWRAIAHRWDQLREGTRQ